ncbi:MAG: sulfotransferase family protein [Gammaproteobacteria bacterium]
MLRVIGAGLGRTGTSSLKLALEQLLDGRCYHMREVFENMDHIPLWRQAALGHEPDWHTLFMNYKAAVDWPVASFWPELGRTFPDALVILSLRDPETWWQSAHETIFSTGDLAPETEGHAMWIEIVTHRFTSQLDDKDACIGAFNRHNDQVRRTVASERLLEWDVTDGWAPLCAALDMPIPDEPFPHSNSRKEFQDRINQRME